MKVLALLNIKGGVAKTTTVTTVSHLLAEKYNKKVLVVDLDPQANTTALFADEDYFQRFIEKANGNPQTEDKSICNVLVGEDVRESIMKTKYANLDIIKSDLRLAEIENMLKADVTVPQQFKLKRALDQVADEYDYCLLDCSPSINLININGLTVADEVYIPTRADGYSLDGVMLAQSLVETVAGYNTKIKVGGVFFTAWENHNCHKTAYQLLEKILGDQLLPFRINKNKHLTENTMRQKPLLELDKGQRTKATQAYVALTEYILAKDKEKFVEEYKNRENG
ncbi:chromosome partitioning protein [Lachnospiraceae bacterium PM6-15]|uniref:ParA family protein n=1 Tax=Ohessyouella blattaphilus TaxID=2949333 RepID=UPI003E32A287